MYSWLVVYRSTVCHALELHCRYAVTAHLGSLWSAEFVDKRVSTKPVKFTVYLSISVPFGLIFFASSSACNKKSSINLEFKSVFVSVSFMVHTPTSTHSWKCYKWTNSYNKHINKCLSCTVTIATRHLQWSHSNSGNHMQ